MTNSHKSCPTCGKTIEIIDWEAKGYKRCKICGRFPKILGDHGPPKPHCYCWAVTDENSIVYENMPVTAAKEILRRELAKKDKIISKLENKIKELEDTISINLGG